jgi:hypothetical protein
MGWSICQSKRHNQIFEQPISSGENGLGYILELNSDLLIARFEINFRKYPGSRELIE